MEERDLRRIAFVTRRYTDLRAGILRAFLLPLVLALGRAGEHGSPFLLLLVAVAGAIVAANTWLETWVDRRFGRVRASDGPRLTVVAGVGLFILTSRGDHAAIGSGRPSLLFLAIAAYAAWLCLRNWPFTPYYAVPALAATGAAFLFTFAGDRDAYLLWERHAYFTAVATWSFAGCLDWLLLARAMKHRRARRTDAEPS
jgi:hypothetical protein